MADLITINYLMDYTLIIGIALMVSIIIRELIITKVYQNKEIGSFMTIINALIIPLLILFTIIILYKASTVMHTYPS